MSISFLDSANVAQKYDRWTQPGWDVKPGTEGELVALIRLARLPVWGMSAVW